jgi:hypothetical protein
MTGYLLEHARQASVDVSGYISQEDIARRSLLQSLNVPPVLDRQGTETGMSRNRPAAAVTERSSF